MSKENATDRRMTDEQAGAQAAVLSMATPETRVFAIELGARMGPDKQFALERMQRNGWVRLIDLSPITEVPGRVFRLFQASEEAMTWFRKRQ
jgi:hypothetical protein